jgi:hypothetical protein
LGDWDGRWGFEQRDEIIPLRHAMRLLGGRLRHKPCLAWDAWSPIRRTGPDGDEHAEMLEPLVAALPRNRYSTGPGRSGGIRSL